MRLRLSSRRARQVQAATVAFNHAFRLAQLTPKAMAVLGALQSGQVARSEAYDELDAFLDDFISKYIDGED